MNLGSQIKKYRMELSLSQDQLAEKIFVSRQSISNWENDKTYPDIKSLLLLSEVFDVSLDQLIKGDIHMMKKEIDAQAQEQFHRDSTIFSVLFSMAIVLMIPLNKLRGKVGLAVWVVIFAAALYYGFRVDRHKKKYNIQTYKEILAFTEGKSLSEIELAQEKGKRPYQKLFIVIGFMILAVIIIFAMEMLYRIF